MLRHPGRSAVVLALLLTSLSSPARAALPADAWWTAAYHHAGVQGRIVTMLSRPGEIYVGGSIVAVGDMPARNVARFETADGMVTGWNALGAGLNGSVAALVEHDGQVVAGGLFTSSGETALNRVARWDGAEWQPFGGGLPGVTVNCLASFDGDLYAGGYRWDGAAWTNVLQTNGPVRTLTVRGGLLYVGGDFSAAGAVNVENVFAWDGVQVIPLGAGLPDPVVEAVAMPDGVVFGTVGASDLGDVRRWDGAAWVSVVEDIYLESLGTYGGELVVCWWHRVNSYLWIPSIRVYDGGWSTMIGGFITGQMLEHEGRLLVEAGVDVSPTIVSPGLIAWDGAQLQPAFVPNDGFDDGFKTLVPIGGPYVVAGGDFKIVQGRVTDGVGITKGADWFPCGGGADFGPEGHFRDLAYVNGETYCIYTYFEIDINIDVLGKLTWLSDHWGWVSLDSGMSLGELQSVGQELYSIDYQSVSHVDLMTGDRTELPGLDLDRGISGACEHEGQLVICGDFSANGGVPCGTVLRRVNGVWQDLGTPEAGAMAEQVVSLGNGGLAVSYAVPDTPERRVARFDGAQWVDLGDAFSGAISRLASHRGWLFAAGYFTRVGAVDAAGIAMWTGATWMPVGSGLTGSRWVNAYDLVSTGTSLWVCGDFTLAGGKPCVGLSRWDGDPAWLAALSGTPQELPPAARLSLSAWPNPFNPRVDLSFTLPVAGRLSLAVFDARGARVRRLLDGDLEAGEHRETWDGLDDAGRPLPSGLYVARLRAGGVAEAIKLTLVR